RALGDVEVEVDADLRPRIAAEDVHLAPIGAQHTARFDELGVDLRDRLRLAPDVAVEQAHDVQIEESAARRGEVELRQTVLAAVPLVTSVVLEVLRPSLAELGVQAREPERLAPAVVVAHVVPPADPNVAADRYQIGRLAA